MRTRLTTDRLELLPFKTEHAPQVANLLQRNMDRLFDAFQISVKAITGEAGATGWIATGKAAWRNNHKYFRGLFLKDTGQYIGMIVLKRNYPGAPMAELAYYIDEAWEGKGLMTEALDATVKWSDSELGIAVLYVRIASENTGSRSVVEKLGFEYTRTVPEGLVFPSGNYDMACYQRVI